MQDPIDPTSGEVDVEGDQATNLLVLYGNLSVLGLLILKHHSRRPKETDISLCKFVQAVVRFLWDAHNCEESLDEEELQVNNQRIFIRKLRKLTITYQEIQSILKLLTTI